MLKKDIKAVKDLFIDERECGHTICDFDDYDHDLCEIAEVIGVDMDYNEDEEEFIFKNDKDKTRTEEALNYYYELHNC